MNCFGFRTSVSDTFECFRYSIVAIYRPVAFFGFDICCSDNVFLYVVRETERILEPGTLLEVPKHILYIIIFICFYLILDGLISIS